VSKLIKVTDLAVSNRSHLWSTQFTLHAGDTLDVSLV
jgi:hypothetical protein